MFKKRDKSSILYFLLRLVIYHIHMRSDGEHIAGKKCKNR